MSSQVVVVTRRPEDNAALATLLRTRGLDVIELPCVRTEPLADREELDRELASLRPKDLLVLTSRAGVDAVAATRRAIPCAVAVVGPATGERARASGLAVAFAASHADSATLGRELPLPSGDVVLARSDLADGDLPMVLRERGSRVREIVAYRTVPAVSGDAHAVRDAIGAGRATIVVASPSAVTALRDALGAAELRTATFVAIGAPTARAVRETIGVHPIIAARTDARAVADAIPREPQEVTT